MTLSGDWLYWLAMFGALIIGGILIYAAWWALFADRPRGRRRCPKCWYDMAYSPGMTCAECGFIARRESQFHRRKRRYGWAVVSIVSCVILAAIINDQAAQRGVASMLPTRLLLWLMPFSGTSAASPYGEVLNRAGGGQLSDGQFLALFERAAAGDWGARPVSDAWIQKYGQIIGNYRRSYADDKKLEAPLRSIPPRLDVTTAETWPLDMPVTVGVQLRDWWPWGMECRIRATPRNSGGDGKSGRTVTFYRSGEDRFQRAPYSLHLPPLDPAADRLVIDFEIARRPMPPEGNRAGRAPAEEPSADPSAAPENPWEPVTTQTVTLKTQAKGTIDELFTGIDNPAMASAMDQVFRQGTVKWSAGRSPVRYYINVQGSFVPAFDDTAVGVKAELLCDGKVARRLNLWWLAGMVAGGGGLSLPERHYGYEVDFEDQDLLKAAATDDGRWTMRITGDPAIAMRAGRAKHFWSGQITMPLRMRENQGQSPRRPWWTEEEVGSASEE